MRIAHPVVGFTALCLTTVLGFESSSPASAPSGKEHILERVHVYDEAPAGGGTTKTIREETWIQVDSKGREVTLQTRRLFTYYPSDPNSFQLTDVTFYEKGKIRASFSGQDDNCTLEEAGLHGLHCKFIPDAYKTESNKPAVAWTDHVEEVLDESNELDDSYRGDDRRFLSLLKNAPKTPPSTQCQASKDAWDAGFADAMSGTKYVITHEVMESHILRAKVKNSLCSPSISERLGDCEKTFRACYDFRTDKAVSYKDDQGRDRVKYVEREDLSATEKAKLETGLRCCLDGFQAGGRKLLQVAHENLGASVLCRRDFTLGQNDGKLQCQKCDWTSFKAPPSHLGCYSLGFEREFSKCDSRVENFLKDSIVSINPSRKKAISENTKSEEPGLKSSGAR